MKRSTLSTWVYVSLVFLSGAVVGAFAHRLYVVNTVVSAKPDEYRRKLVDEMRSRLSLSDAQVAQLTPIFDATKARYHEVKNRWDAQAKEAARPELKAITQDQVAQIKAILTADQRTEYDKFLADRAKRHQQNNAAKPSPPPAN